MLPVLVKKRALDVLPYLNAIWCSVGDSEPFANTIESRTWSEDGSKIWFMLGTHNYLSAAPDDEIEVVEIEDSASPEIVALRQKFDTLRMANRPSPPRLCPTCGQAVQENNKQDIQSDSEEPAEDLSDHHE